MSATIDTYANGKPWAVIQGTPIYRAWTQGGGIPLHFWRSLAPHAGDVIDGHQFDVRTLPGGHERMSGDEMKEVISGALESGILKPKGANAMSNTESRRAGRPCYGGSPEAAEADRERRRAEYVELRTRLAMSPAELAKLVGLSRHTVGLYPGSRSRQIAPTRATLSKMRAEIARRAVVAAEEAEARAEIARDIAELEVRLHMQQCAAEAEPWEDAA